MQAFVFSTSHRQPFKALWEKYIFKQSSAPVSFIKCLSATKTASLTSAHGERTHRVPRRQRGKKMNRLVQGTHKVDT